MKDYNPHNLPNNVVLEDTLELDIGTLFFYSDFIVAEFAEGISLSYKNGFSIILKALQIFGRRPCFYISNRINSYALNPNDYKYLERVPSLKGVAIVTTIESRRSMAKLEANFFKKPFKIFNDLETAYEWGKSILYDEKTT